MQQVIFNKPAKNYDEQIDILLARGMEVESREYAKNCLKHINYYRLGAYWLPFEVDHEKHQFKKGVHFENVIALYEFDRQLRLLVAEACECVEISVRAVWAYCMAHHYGAHGYINRAFYVRDTLSVKDNKKQDDQWRRNKDDLAKEVNRSPERFMHHIREKYSEQFPPVWAAAEIMSFGLLSRFYGGFLIRKTRRWIAKAYGLDDDILESWLHHLAIIRNICAHHSRLWNRDFSKTPMVPKTKPQGLDKSFSFSAQGKADRGLYNSLVILLYFMGVIKPDTMWGKRLKDLLITAKEIEGEMCAEARIDILGNIGFPLDWQTRSIWQ